MDPTRFCFPVRTDTGAGPRLFAKLGVQQGVLHWAAPPQQSRGTYILGPYGGCTIPPYNVPSNPGINTFCVLNITCNA
eukprot:scaffold144899_cov20-Prasinocladus_malaysianus.AAC.1